MLVIGNIWGCDCSFKNRGGANRNTHHEAIPQCKEPMNDITTQLTPLYSRYEQVAFIIHIFLILKYLRYFRWWDTEDFLALFSLEQSICVQR